MGLFGSELRREIERNRFYLDFELFLWFEFSLGILLYYFLSLYLEILELLFCFVLLFIFSDLEPFELAHSIFEMNHLHDLYVIRGNFSNRMTFYDWLLYFLFGFASLWLLIESLMCTKFKRIITLVSLVLKHWLSFVDLYGFKYVFDRYPTDTFE